MVRGRCGEKEGEISWIAGGDRFRGLFRRSFELWEFLRGLSVLWCVVGYEVFVFNGFSSICT